MSNIPISSLPVAISIGGSELVPIVQGGTTKRTTVSTIGNFPAGNESFITATQSTTLGSARLLAVTSPLTLSDNGPGSTAVIGLGGSIGTATGLSVIGNSTNAVGIPGSIPGTVDQILRVASTGTSMGFGALNLSAGGTSVAGILGVPWGGIGVTSLTVNGLVYGNGTSAVQVTGAAANSILQTNGASVPFLSQTLPLAVQQNITTVGTVISGTWNASILGVPFGGTGTATVTANGIVFGNGTGSIGVTSAAANSVLATNAASAPSLTQTLPLAVQSNITTVGVIASGTWQGGIVQVPYGGTGTSAIASNGIVFGNGTASIGVTASAANSILATAASGVPSLSQTLPLAVQSNITTLGTVSSGTWQGTILDVPRGGTGTSALTAHGIVLGNGGSPVNITAAMTAGQLLVGQSAAADPLPTTVVGDITLSAGGTATIPANSVTFAKFQQVAGLSVVGVTGTATANVAAITGVAYQPLRVNSAGTGLAFGAIDLSQSPAVTGNLPTTNLNSGTNATANTFWRGDGVWSTPSGGGSVTSVAAGTGLATIGGLPITSSGTMTLSAARLTLPTLQTFTSGTTYTTPANALWIKVRMTGGGGGSGGAGTSGMTAGGNGGDSSFNSVVATGGNGGATSATADPGTETTAGAGTASLRIQGQSGAEAGNISSVAVFLAGGGSSVLGFAFPSRMTSLSNPGITPVGKGAGASGGSGDSATYSGGGPGGGSEYVELLINSPAATYTYAVGAGGTAGTGLVAGAAGQGGIIYVEEHYGS